MAKQRSKMGYRNGLPVRNPGKMHTTGAPLLMVALTGLYFHVWLQRAAEQVDRSLRRPVGLETG